MRFPFAVMMLVVAFTMGCRSQAGDPQCVLDGAGDMVRSANEQNQTQANFQPGVAVSKEGDVQANSTRLGVDVQGAAQGAPNPLTIHSIAGGSEAASILKAVTPEEAGWNSRLARIQRYLDQANQDLSLEQDPTRQHNLKERIAHLEGQESLAIAALAEIYQKKIERAATLVPDLSNLQSVVYNVFQSNEVTSGKAMTDVQSTVTADAMKAYLEKVRAASGGAPNQEGQ